MIEDDENQFYSYNEDEDECENDKENEKVILYEDNDERSMSTAVNQNQNESNETNKKENYNEAKVGRQEASNRNLCDIILENLNRRGKPKSSIQIEINSFIQSSIPPYSDFISTNDSSEKSNVSSTLLSTYNTGEGKFRKFRQNISEKNLDEHQENFEQCCNRKNVDNENNNISNMSNKSRNNFELVGKNEILDSINNSRNENLPSAHKTKVPLLVNSLEAIYDMNSDRNKKRLEQIKLRITKTVNASTEHLISYEDQLKPNKIKVLSSKKFLEEEYIINEKNIEPLEAVFPLMINEEREENVEIVVSDLEGEIEDRIIVPKTNNSKSFIPIRNHLKSKSSSTVGKSTPSYLMALGFHEENSSDVNNEDDECEYNINNSNEKSSYNTFMNKQNNYFVADVIEEETSENNTDSEMITSRQRASYLFRTKGSSRASEDGSHLESPLILSARSSKIQTNSNPFNSVNNSLLHKAIPFNNAYTEFRYSNSDIPCGPYLNEGHKNSLFPNNYSLNDEGNRSSLSKKFHKNSKSEYLSLKVDMQQIIENIQKKRDEERNKRKELISLRKSILLNKFLKSNSHHNFPPRNNISAPSFSSFKQDQIKSCKEKKYSICTPKPNLIENISLNKSELTLALNHAYDTSSNHTSKNSHILCENQKQSKNDYDDTEVLIDKASLGSKSNELFKEENCEDNEDLESNRSINVENGDQDINFESELNLQLERNDIDTEYNEDNFFNMNEQEEEVLSYDYNNENNSKSIEKIKKPSLDNDNIKANRFLANNFYSFSSINKNLINSIIPKGNISSNILLRKNRYAGRSNSLTFLTPIKSPNNKLTLSKPINTKSNLEIAKAAILQITPSTISNNSKTIFHNNYINNNINNISINIMNSDCKAKQLAINKKIHFKSNSITNEIKNRFATHVKSSSAFLLKPQIHNELRYESSSCSKNFKTGQSILDSSKLKKSLRHSELVSSGKAKMLMHKKDLKQFLTFSDSKSHFSENSKTKNLFNYLVQTNSNSSSMNFDKINPKFNSDHVAYNLVKCSNRLIITEAMKSLRFQLSSLDHQKFCLDRMSRSKAKSFCLLISKEFTFQNFEFKGLFEMNEEKNLLAKVYSVNGYPSQIEIDEIKSFYYFNTEYNSFEVINDNNKISCDIHAVSIQDKTKNFMKQNSSVK